MTSWPDLSAWPELPLVDIEGSNNLTYASSVSLATNSPGEMSPLTDSGYQSGDTSRTRAEYHKITRRQSPDLDTVPLPELRTSEYKTTAPHPLHHPDAKFGHPYLDLDDDGLEFHQPLTRAQYTGETGRNADPFSWTPLASMRPNVIPL